MPFGVSNSFKRGIVKTYARPILQLEDDDAGGRPFKRRCLSPVRSLSKGNEQEDRRSRCPSPIHSSSDVQSSSPLQASLPLYSSDAVGDNDSDLSTPPSSPTKPISPPPRRDHKPAFAVLKRQQGPDTASKRPLVLSEISANERRMPPMSKPKGRKIQMQIDLGGEVRKTCRSCGMEYLPSHKEDAALHREYCGMNEAGIDMGKTFLKDQSLRSVHYTARPGAKIEDVVMVDQRSAPTLKTKVRNVLGVVNTDLSAADIPEESLWHEPSATEADEPKGQKRKRLPTPTEPPIERFKAFLAMEGEKCIGFCLVEKIKEAFPVVREDTKRKIDGAMTAGVESSSISHSSSADLALLGISRIWVSKAFRGHGIAQTLLDAAQNSFFYGIQIPKSLIAFSQPTESGRALAVKWFGQKVGWRVYVGRT